MITCHSSATFKVIAANLVLLVTGDITGMRFSFAFSGSLSVIAIYQQLTPQVHGDAMRLEHLQQFGTVNLNAWVDVG